MNADTERQERRLVVVTGGSSGIGLACADRFRRDGADVRVADVQGPQYPVDISDEASVDTFFASLPSAPSVLVNAAGVGLGAHILDLDIATWRKVFAVNLDGAFLCLRAAARRMAAAGGGVIVNVTSVNYRVPMRTHAAYCSAKAALTMLTQVAALDLGASNIRVVAVAPGVIDTPLVSAALAIPQVRAAMQERTAVGDAMGTPTDVAELVEFLASDRARWNHRRDGCCRRRAIAARVPRHRRHCECAGSDERGCLVIKVELLLAVVEDVPPGSALAAAIGGDDSVRATVHEPSLLSALAHGEATDSAPPFRCLLELACDSPESAGRRIEWVAAQLLGVDGVDRALSTAVAGPEYIVVPGDEQIMLGMALTRRHEMSREAFSEYWRTAHAELGRSVPGSEGYRQVHLDQALTEYARQTLGFGGPLFDGMALAYYSSQVAFEAIMANTEVTSALLSDERRFIDHSKAAMIVGRQPAGSTN